MLKESSQRYRENSRIESLQELQINKDLFFKAVETLRMPFTTLFLAGITLNLACRRIKVIKLAAEGSTVTAVILRLSANSQSAA